jgi:hypothetical protein
LKLDISKAFDSISWPFLLEVMHHMGFGTIWRHNQWVATQVLMNGIPGRKIFHKQGLRQGDSLLPMLFIMVMNVLRHMVSKAAEEGMLQPPARWALQHRISLYAEFFQDRVAHALY